MASTSVASLLLLHYLLLQCLALSLCLNNTLVNHFSSSGPATKKEMSRLGGFNIFFFFGHTLVLLHSGNVVMMVTSSVGLDDCVTSDGEGLW